MFLWSKSHICIRDRNFPMKFSSLLVDSTAQCGLVKNSVWVLLHFIRSQCFPHCTHVAHAFSKFPFLRICAYLAQVIWFFCEWFQMRTEIRAARTKGPCACVFHQHFQPARMNWHTFLVILSRLRISSRHTNAKAVSLHHLLFYSRSRIHYKPIWCSSII